MRAGGGLDGGSGGSEGSGEVVVMVRGVGGGGGRVMMDAGGIYPALLGMGVGCK